jgi:hypothetical protein
VISRSPTDVQPVFDAIAASATRLCEGSDSNVFRLEDGVLRLVAIHGDTVPTPRVLGDKFIPTREVVSGRAVIDRQTVHVHDLAAQPEGEYAGAKRFVAAGLRTVLATPLLRKGVPIGVILIRPRGGSSIYRQSDRALENIRRPGRHSN